MADTKYNSKIIFYGETLMDLTGDTVDAASLLKGKTAHDKTGAPITGTCPYNADTSDATATAAEILNGKTAYVDGAKVTGTMPNKGAVTLSIVDKSPVTIPAGYHDGSGSAVIDSTEAAEPEQQQTDLAVLQGRRVLLAEDNELNMEIAEFFLEDMGAETMQAWNGKEAVEAFRNSAPGEIGVILMDIMMPVMDGLEAVQRIRALDRPDAKTVPIIAMTANAFSEDVERSRKAGMTEHLSKPLNAETLKKAILRNI